MLSSILKALLSKVLKNSLWTVLKNLACKYWKPLTVIGIILVGALGVFAVHKYNAALEAEYNRGVLETDQKWERVINNYNDLSAAMKASHTSYVKGLEEKLTTMQKDLDATKDKVNNKVVEYAQTEQAKEKCLDDDFVEIYNDSLGAD